MRSWVFVAAIASGWPAWAQLAPQPADAPQPPDWVVFEGSVRLVTGSGPRLRLEQDTTAGRPGRIWDLGGDERELFLIDLTAFTKPVRIDAGGQWTSRRVAIEGSTGDVNLGTSEVQLSSPVPLYLSNLSDAYELRLLVEEASPKTASRNLLRLVNNGPSNMAFDSGSQPSTPLWFSGSISDGNFGIATPQAGTAFRLTPAGNLTIAGTLTQLSDRDAKHDVRALDREALLEQMAALPVSTWSYLGDEARHIGPMAEDFARAFGLGPDDRHVAPSDVAGVGLAAVQALHEQARGLTRRIERGAGRLEREDARLLELQASLARLEAAVPTSQP